MFELTLKHHVLKLVLFGTQHEYALAINQGLSNALAIRSPPEHARRAHHN